MSLTFHSTAPVRIVISELPSNISTIMAALFCTDSWHFSINFNPYSIGGGGAFFSTALYKLKYSMNAPKYYPYATYKDKRLHMDWDKKSAFLGFQCF